MEGMEDVEEPPWLDPGERDTWLRLTSVLIHLPTALDEQLRRDAGVTYFEYQLLAVLSEQPDRAMRLSVLAELTNASLTKLSRAVDRLLKRGLVTREPDPEDGRYTLGRLTDAGWDVVVATAPSHVREVRRLIFDALSDAQVRELGEIAARLQQPLGLESHPHRPWSR